MTLAAGPWDEQTSELHDDGKELGQNRMQSLKNSCDDEEEDTRMAEHIVRSCLLLS